MTAYAVIFLLSLLFTMNSENMTMAQQETNVLFEQSNLNLGGKVFLTALSAWIVGKKVNTKIRGTSQEIKVVTNALLASRRLHDELNRNGSTIKSVIQLIQQKQKTTAEFERLFGLKWPL